MPVDGAGTPFGGWPPDRAWDMEAYHLAAMDFQMSQLYYGVQLALALGRALVLPKVRQQQSAAQGLQEDVPPG